ncbi:MAG: hypothetical protein ACRDLB_10255 [Actinomycetota bacterium]
MTRPGQHNDDPSFDFILLGFVSVLGGVVGLVGGGALGYVYSWLFVPSNGMDELVAPAYGAMGGGMLGIVVAVVGMFRHLRSDEA